MHDNFGEDEKQQMKKMTKKKERYEWLPWGRKEGILKKKKKQDNKRKKAKRDNLDKTV